MMKQNAKRSAAVPLRKLHICLTAGCGAISLTMLLTAYAMLSGQSRTVQRILSVLFILAAAAFPVIFYAITNGRRIEPADELAMTNMNTARRWSGTILLIAAALAAVCWLLFGKPVTVTFTALSFLLCLGCIATLYAAVTSACFLVIDRSSTAAEDEEDA